MKREKISYFNILILTDHTNFKTNATFTMCFWHARRQSTEFYEGRFQLLRKNLMFLICFFGRTICSKFGREPVWHGIWEKTEPSFGGEEKVFEGVCAPREYRASVPKGALLAPQAHVHIIEIYLVIFIIFFTFIC